MMSQKSLSFYLLLQLCALLSQARADCQLSEQLITDTNRIFAILQNGNYFPLQEDVVGTGQTLELMCSTQNVQQIICQADGTFSIPQAINSCSSAPKAIVDAVVDDSCPHIMYRVGYKMSDDQFLEIYRSCYDVSTSTAHFTIHATYRNSISTARPSQAFTTDGVLTGAIAASYEAKQVYARFVELYGSTQTYAASAKDMIFDRGHLAPSGDFFFPQDMRGTFKYLNVVAQFRTINRSNWKSIENWVRRQLVTEGHDYLHMCTGGLGVLQLPNGSGALIPLYLAAGDRNPVPEWLYKIVSDESGSRVAFLTYNNVHESQAPEPNCNQVACPDSTNFGNTKESGFTFCCDADSFIASNAPYLANVC